MKNLDLFSQKEPGSLSNPLLVDRVVACLCGQGEDENDYAQGLPDDLRDAASHLAYLEASMKVASPALFLDYVDWLAGYFAGQGYAETAVSDLLACLQKVLPETLPSELSSLAQTYLTQAIAQQQQGHTMPQTFLTQDAPLATLVQQYTTFLLGGERHKAAKLVIEAAQTGTPVKDLYQHVFEPSQREIGRLWQINEISVAQEHYCTAATQLIMSRLYPYVFDAPRNGRTLVACSAAGELHELGMRMVADFFEMEGWSTFYLGSNLPAKDIAQIVLEHQVDMLAISATMAPHLQAVYDLITFVRQRVPEVLILVGGYPFNRTPDLWQQIGADGCAPNAQEAVAAANQLLLKVKK